MDQANDLRKLVKETNNIKVTKFNKDTRVIAVASGKGGVGKSNLVANLAISFAKLDKKVMVIDADLGLANIEVIFGEISRLNFNHLINGEATIKEIENKGPLGITFLSGGSGLRELSNITSAQLQRLIESFNYIDDEYDIILIDTGAGISDIVLNFIKSADEAIIITTPEPTSITDAYALMKVLKEEDIEDLNVNVIINRTENEQEGLEAYNKLVTVVERFLKIPVKNLGFLPNDPNLVRAVKKQVPVALSYPNSQYVTAITQVANKILYNNNLDVMPSTSTKKGFASKLLYIFTRK